MDAVFFVLLWIAVPTGGFSEIFGAKGDCVAAQAAVLAHADTLYSSDCIEVQMKFVKSVQQEYRKPTEVRSGR